MTNEHLDIVTFYLMLCFLCWVLAVFYLEYLSQIFIIYIERISKLSLIYQFDTELTDVFRIKDIVFISDLHSYFCTRMYIVYIHLNPGIQPCYPDPHPTATFLRWNTSNWSVCQINALSSTRTRNQPRLSSTIFSSNCDVLTRITSKSMIPLPWGCSIRKMHRFQALPTLSKQALFHLVSCNPIKTIAYCSILLHAAFNNCSNGTKLYP